MIAQFYIFQGSLWDSLIHILAISQSRCSGIVFIFIGIKKDYSTWDPRDLKFVACKIAEKVNKFLNTDSDIPFLMKRVSTKWI